MKETDAIPVVDKDVPPVEVKSEAFIRMGEVCQFFDFGSRTVHSGYKHPTWSYYFAGMLEQPN